MFQVVALILKRVKALVLDFPAALGATCEYHDVVFVDFKIGHPALCSMNNLFSIGARGK